MFANIVLMWRSVEHGAAVIVLINNYIFCVYFSPLEGAERLQFGWQKHCALNVKIILRLDHNVHGGSTTSRS